MIRILAATIALAVCFIESPVGAQPDFLPRGIKLDLKYSAMNIAAFLKAHGENKIVLDFRGPAVLKGSGEKAFAERLADELKKHGISAADEAKYVIEGRINPEKELDRLNLRISMKIVDAFGKAQWDNDLGFPITSEQEVLSLLGATVEIGARKGEDRTAAINDAFDKPKIEIVDRIRAKASNQSRYGVEVLVNDKPRSLDSRAGKAFVPMNLNEEYAIRLFNDSDTEVAVRVHVDGLSIFHFSEERATAPDRLGEPLYRYYTVAARSSTTVPGWYKTGKKSLAFKIAPLEESLAAKIGKTKDIGMITAMFHASWEKTARPPADEPPINPYYRNPGLVKITPMAIRGPDGKVVNMQIPETVYADVTERVGTTFGSDKTTSTRGVERTIGQLRSAVTIRYEMRKEK